MDTKMKNIIPFSLFEMSKISIDDELKRFEEYKDFISLILKDYEKDVILVFNKNRKDGDKSKDSYIKFEYSDSNGERVSSTDFDEFLVNLPYLNGELINSNLSITFFNVKTQYIFNICFNYNHIVLKSETWGYREETRDNLLGMFNEQFINRYFLNSTNSKHIYDKILKDTLIFMEENNFIDKNKDKKMNPRFLW